MDTELSSKNVPSGIVSQSI